MLARAETDSSGARVRVGGGSFSCGWRLSNASEVRLSARHLVWPGPKVFAVGSHSVARTSAKKVEALITFSEHDEKMAKMGTCKVGWLVVGRERRLVNRKTAYVCIWSCIPPSLSPYHT